MLTAEISEIWNTVQATGNAVNAFLVEFVGGFDKMLHTLIVFIIANYTTCLFSVIIRKKLSREVGMSGIIKKVTIFIVVGIGNLMDMHLLGGGTALRTSIVFFYIANELVSFIENCAVVGIPIPQSLMDALVQIKKKFGSDSTDR